jgi:GT2 family glycosyltransferase
MTNSSVEPPSVDAVVLAWQAEPYLRPSVEALLASTDVNVHVYLVDNGCTTDDVALLSRLDGVTLITPTANLGFSGGCNVGADAGEAPYLALINQDLVVQPGTLARLVRELDDERVGIAAAAVHLADEPHLLNSSGNAIHVLGLSWVGGLGESDERTQPTNVAGAMGACVVMRRDHWRRIGGFYEKYFAYHEDAEISLRTHMMGLRVHNVPDAVALHRYEFSRNSNKYYLVERNRLMFVLTLWGGRSLLLLSPALLGLEFAMVALAVKQGWLLDKMRGWWWLWGHRAELRERRAIVRGSRTVPDRIWMRLLTDRLDTPLIELPGAVQTPLNTMMRAYWTLVRRLV